MWQSLDPDSRLRQDEADAMTGMDLWLYVRQPSGYRYVTGGHHFQGYNEGFYHDTGGPIDGEVTHYWIRDFKPEPPQDY